MGAYLSEPVTDKVSSDDNGERVNYGASSMQGWRVSQEDAHNCIIDFDKNTSLFAVYDGHGGHEVAVYTAQELPTFIKATEAYKKGDYKNALIDAFLGFDATIATRDVVAVLKEIAGAKDNEAGPVDGSSEDEENVSNLYEEASMPIEQVIEKYQSGITNPNLKKLQSEKLPNSPFLRARKTPENEIESGASSSKCADTSTDTNVVSSTNSDLFTHCALPTSQKCENVNKEEATSAEDSLLSPDSSNTVAITESKETIKTDLNGELKVTSKNENECSSTTTQENGELKLSKKGKGKAVKKNSEAPTRSKSLRIRNARQLYNKLLDFEDDTDSDENDETFEGATSNSSSEVEDAAESSEAADEDEADEEEDEDLLEDEDDEFTRNITEEPGSDSGCTAVVALIHGNELYVANAGDSRCIVCRNGQAVEMSFDHKPEDEPEMDRIVKAGGKVTQDGRVNGGLNLSRAIGDHAYKQNKDLSDKEQMITALPDVRVLTIDSSKDEFMVLACDGIWNFMSSQEVVEFVRPRLQETIENNDRLSKICEEMFCHCLAPNTMGDGTGCDNMTAIIVQFNSSRLPKRSASPNGDTEDTSLTKRMRTEDTN